MRSIWLQDFLSFNASPALWLDPGLTVITGPNGAGKSNLARSLDVARAVLAPHDHPESGRLDLYREAGFEGPAEFTIKVDMVLDQPWEQALVRTHVQAAYLTSGPGRSQQAADSLEGTVDWLVADSLTPLLAGTLVVRYRATAARPWAAYWEFSDEDTHIRQPDYADPGSREQFRQLQLIQPAEIRALLFAQAAVLCEGQTEPGALPRWWNNARTSGLPDLGAANVSFIGVDGHNGYRAYIKFLDAYGIPWAIISDGPALRKGRKLSLDMQKAGPLA